MSNVDLDELDLNFDGLDDDEESSKPSKPKQIVEEKSSNSSKSTDLVSNSKDSNNNEDDDDELIFKVPLVPIAISQNSNKQPPKSNDHLNDEFKFNDDNDEDEFIRSQPMFSSTQSGLDSNGGFKIPAIPPEVKNTPISSDDNDNWEFISTQTTKELFEQSQQHRKLDTSRETTINNSVVELIDNKEVWNYGFERLNDLFKNTRLRNALKKFTIDFYLKKLLQFNLLKIVDEGVPQLPLICVFITEISRANVNSHASVILADDKSLIKGTIHKSIAKEHWSKLTVGTVLLLQDVSLIRMGKSSNPYQVWVDKENLLYIYYKNSQEDDSIDVYKYNEMKISEIEGYVDEFESKFVKVSERILNMSVNKSNTSTLNSTSSKSTSSGGATKANQNNQNRPAPYKVPDKFSKPTANVTSKTTTTANKQNPHPQNPPQQQPQKRVFSFKNAANKSSSENHNDSTIICLSSSTQETPNQNIPSTNRQVLSEEQLSQLIFGLEDEF